MDVAKFLLFLTASLVGTDKQLATARMVTNMSDAIEYMEQYGYINRTTMESMEGMSQKSKSRMMTEKMKMFQMFSGVNGTGELDSKTMDMMNAPRCGNKENMEMMRNADLDMTSTNHRAPWQFADIRYRIENFPDTGLSPEVVRREIRKAFSLWEAVANLTCTEVPHHDTKEVDIDISFVTGPHNDNQPFSPRLIGVPVAHAFFPYPDDPKIHHHLGGDIHFDSKRGWTVNTADGINFFQIATHEIGHSLGLEHSAATHSVMHAIPPSKYDPAFGLHRDDIEGIQKLYGARIHDKNSFQRLGVQPRGFQPAVVAPSSEEELPPHDLGYHSVESPSVVVMYYFQPLKYLWHCHQLAAFHPPDSLGCYEQVTHLLLQQQQKHFHSQ